MTLSHSDAIKLLALQKHPEGDYFAETDRQTDQVPSPFAHRQPRPLATTIYYLLTPDQPEGVFHMNKSVTMHLLHQGRAEYTLIYPDSVPPRVETVIIGPNIDRGERLQLLVGSNVWKKSKLLDEDVRRAHTTTTATTTATAEHTGCLISEVVFPGFHWEDHRYLTRRELEDTWKGDQGWEKWVDFTRG